MICPDKNGECQCEYLVNVEIKKMHSVKEHPDCTTKYTEENIMDMLNCSDSYKFCQCVRMGRDCAALLVDVAVFL